MRIIGHLPDRNMRPIMHADTQSDCCNDEEKAPDRAG
ncbi:hypothetical protein BRPE67_ACDS13520 [Caballeronia cordobensis]|nr:hypothetical protein BRPE67_ACDS13520 [Burkholderia sp. RPE67]